MQQVADPASARDAVEELLAEYGVHDVLGVTPTASEVDRTWLVATRRGGLVVKRSPRGSDAPRMQAGLLALAARDASLPLPRLLTSATTGAALSADGTAFVTTLCPGRPLEEVTLTEDLAAALARHQAAVMNALADADAAALGVPDVNAWSLDSVVEYEPLVDAHAPTGTADVLRAVIDDYRARVLPVRGDLPTQVIHADVNLSNVLVADDGTVSGIIDFGDAVLAPRVYDVAVAACYLALAGGASDHQVVRHYLERAALLCGLSALEVSLLRTLVRCRLAIVVLLGRESARRAPERAAYALRYDHLAERLLASVAGEQRRDAFGPEGTIA
ncbi:phosphotransferase enzyme family protein [Streptomyces radicis]|nr:phosphotransferase [Streptomyces radicis]